MQQFGSILRCDKLQKMKKLPEKREKNLVKSLQHLCQGLVYLSETDAEFSVFIGQKTENITKQLILQQTNSSPNIFVEERSFEDFFERLIKIQDWFGTEQKETAKKFSELQKVLRENLIDKKVFRIGKIQIDIYIVGLDAENNLIGVKTKAVET